MIWSFIKAHMDIINGVLLVFFTASIAYFAYRQHRLEKTRLKLDAYDRRLAVRDAIQAFISHIQIEGTTDNERLFAMLRETKHSKFLFDKQDEIQDYIDSLYKKGLDLEYKQKAVDSERKPLPNEKKEKLWAEIMKLKEWFTKQHDVVDSKFEKYLQL